MSRWMIPFSIFLLMGIALPIQAQDGVLVAGFTDFFSFGKPKKAEVVEVKKPKPLPTLEGSPTRNQILMDLDSAKKQLQADKLSGAMDLLTAVVSRIKEEQRRQLMLFFPEKWADFTLKEELKTDLSAQSNDSYGVMLVRHYANKDGVRVDVSLVLNDPAIEEYVGLIKNPDQIKKIENAELIHVRGASKAQYLGIQKFSKDQRYLEQNIVVNPDILLNIVADGVTDKSAFEALVAKVDLAGIAAYLDR
ncbi:MAG: hypothetical protein AB7F28_06975 [Candidatus Margulisiibacteriota bacterium]